MTLVLVLTSVLQDALQFCVPARIEAQRSGKDSPVDCRGFILSCVGCADGNGNIQSDPERRSSGASAPAAQKSAAASDTELATTWWCA